MHKGTYRTIGFFLILAPIVIAIDTQQTMGFISGMIQGLGIFLINKNI